LQKGYFKLRISDSLSPILKKDLRNSLKPHTLLGFLEPPINHEGLNLCVKIVKKILFVK